jgi:serine O-acetyltransferase
MFDEFRSDFRRHEQGLLNPALWAVWNYRYGRWALGIRFFPFRWLASKIYGLNMFLLLITSGIRLHREVTIGKDFHLIHAGNIHVHPNTVIGDRCGILHNVTIGNNMTGGAPVIGNDVFIGTGAVILGEITIGDGARIAANSLVIRNVPAGATAIGVPAKSRKLNRMVATSNKELTENIKFRRPRNNENPGRP